MKLKAQPKPFLPAAHDFLRFKRDALLSSLTAEQSQRLLAYAGKSWLLPYETLEDIPPSDMFCVCPEVYAIQVQRGFISEREAKWEIARMVEARTKELKSL